MRNADEPFLSLDLFGDTNGYAQGMRNGYALTSKNLKEVDMPDNPLFEECKASEQCKASFTQRVCAIYIYIYIANHNYLYIINLGYAQGVCKMGSIVF